MSATTSSESLLGAAWAALKQQGRTALIPYFTAGHPDRATSLDALRRAEAYADILEVGVPFSDPLADGPTIQRSTFEALERGMTLAGTLELIAEARLSRPVVVFSYLNPIRRYGVERFLRDAATLGAAGLLLTDLPAGSDPEVERQVRASSLDLIRLVAPTTAGRRLDAVARDAQGFLYLVARLGVTGASRDLAANLDEYVERVRAVSRLPLALGFGIATPAQARTVGRLADGVVVGSALVETLRTAGAEGAERFLAGLRQALDEVDAERKR
ncbi:MAG TPA: tryptophan synthase subunit alpha [Gemmatimonadales bacterium]|nr:tryptophan synthase subunit alpha [Gemmatimonadales bacterium]